MRERPLGNDFGGLLVALGAHHATLAALSVSSGVVRAAEIGSALVAAILSPIPLADEFVIAPGLLGLAAIIGHRHGLSLGAMPWRALGRGAFVGMAARASANLAVSCLPGLAAVANAATAFALTRAYAEWVERTCTEQRSMPGKGRP